MGVRGANTQLGTLPNPGFNSKVFFESIYFLINLVEKGFDIFVNLTKKK